MHRLEKVDFFAPLQKLYTEIRKETLAVIPAQYSPVSAHQRRIGTYIAQYTLQSMVSIDEDEIKLILFHNFGGDIRSSADWNHGIFQPRFAYSFPKFRKYILFG